MAKSPMTMSFTPPPRRPKGESIVPMINVVFLLLIFFLMTSRLAPPEPFEVEPPRAEEGAEAVETPVLYLSPEGEAGFEGARGEAAIAAFATRAQAAPGAEAPQLRADAQTEAAEVARVLKALTEAGLSEVSLVVAPR
ncbi:Biopolymer transport protein ExbD/TolR [Pseudooceanicola marinus]|uniref:Biopolymer transport protein ExbD/TolR n=1 Tax=Pseudooceanicola marinus TaxID=396013 RepID=A0A1X6YBJ0_9RHOB|nr:biopolymer transporter ExbD [Pseudooceanicola marinus]SLN16402.1 Biopolymer transport protein ExbD/TolR [Pseudooceanicola marinus]